MSHSGLLRIAAWILAVAGTGLGVIACRSGEPSASSVVAEPAPKPTIILLEPSVPAASLTNQAGQDLGPLHNVLRVTPRMYSGNSPESDEAFAELQALGVKTIISVDGAKPMVDRAAAYGMRYVHLPVGYDGIDPRQQVLIAKAYRDLEGPFLFTATTASIVARQPRRALPSLSAT